MTKPPPGGTAAAPSDTEFGATTMSGTPEPNQRSGPAGVPDRTAERTSGADQVAADRVTDDRSAAGRPRGGVASTTDPTGRPPAGAGAPAQGTPSGVGSIPGVRAGARDRGPRRARLQIRHINPVTVLKFSCVLAVALFFVWLIVIGVLYGVLDAAGAINHINDTVITINGAGSKAPITAGIVFGGAAIVGVVDIVLFIALMTIGAVIYNLCADLVGGIEITLSER